MQREALKRVAARLEKMPRLRREVFVLARLYGYSHAEICARLDLSEAAVKKHIVRASMDCADLFDAIND